MSERQPSGSAGTQELDPIVTNDDGNRAAVLAEADRVIQRAQERWARQDATRESPSDAQDTHPESQEEAETLITDAEILGNSYQVRRTIGEKAGKSMSALHEVRARSLNVLSTPKNLYLERRYEAAMDRAARREARLGTSNFGFINKIHENRHKKAVTKLENRTKAFNSHKGMMDKRISDAQEYHGSKEQSHARRVEMYKDRKLIAEGRKELRNLRRECHTQGASREQVRMEMANLGVEGMKRLGAISCATETSKREAQAIERRRVKAHAKEAKLDRRLTSLMGQTEEKRELQTKMRESLDSYRDEADESRATITELHDQMEELPEDAPERAELVEQIQATRIELDELEQHIRLQEQKISEVNAEVRGLSRKIERQNDKIRSHAYNVEEIDRGQVDHDARREDLDSRIEHEKQRLQQRATTNERNQ